MSLLATALFGVTLLVVVVTLLDLAKAVKNAIKTLEAVRVTIERGCGAGDDE